MTKYNFDRLWASVKRTALGRHVAHEKDLPLADDLLRHGAPNPEAILQLAGATYGNESRRWLIPASYTAASNASTGDKDTFPVHDFLTVTAIGLTFTTAGTTTPLRMEFDRRVTQGSDTSRVAMLDGAVGFLLSPSATQALGSVLWKDIGQTAPVDLEPGDEIVAEVITATTAGVGRSIVLVVPRAKMFADGTGYVLSS